MTDLLSALREALPHDAIAADDAALAEHAADRSGTTRGPGAVVVSPTETAQVQAVMRIADGLGVPVIAQGARTSLAGAASASPGAILIDFSRMNRIVRIDPIERSAVVQPGVVVADLAAAVAAEGLFYAPDPVSSEWATIGGTIATNAGGMRCIKYGVTRDAVRSLEVVLADGEVIRTRRDTVKGVAGFDITGLVVGSEGTLGLVTEATVALRSAPGPERGVSAVFDSIAAALDAANAIATGPRTPSTLELLDDISLDAIRTFDPSLGIPTTAKAWLMAVTDTHADAEFELDAFESAFRAHGAIEVTRAADPIALNALFATRRALHPALQAFHGESIIGDIAVPRARLGDVVARSAAIAEEFGVVFSVGGHVGDGNLHPVVAFDPTDPDQTRRAHEAQHAMLAIAQELGGTVTGEHGVGTEKLHALDGELSPRVRDLQRALKAVFDPKNLLNPGIKI